MTDGHDRSTRVGFIGLGSPGAAMARAAIVGLAQSALARLEARADENRAMNSAETRFGGPA